MLNTASWGQPTDTKGRNRESSGSHCQYASDILRLSPPPECPHTCQSLFQRRPLQTTHYTAHTHTMKQFLTRIHSGIWLRLRRAMCERRVSSQHMVKRLTLNPYISLFNLKLWTHIWSTKINFKSTLHRTFWSVLVWTLNFHPMGELRRGGVSWAADIFLSWTDRNVTTQVAARSMREAWLKR